MEYTPKNPQRRWFIDGDRVRTAVFDIGARDESGLLAAKGLTLTGREAWVGVRLSDSDLFESEREAWTQLFLCLAARISAAYTQYHSAIQRSPYSIADYPCEFTIRKESNAGVI